MFTCYNITRRTNVYETTEGQRMVHADVIRTVFEFLAIVLAIVGLIYEKKVIAFEDMLVRAFKAYRRTRRNKKQRELARQRANMHIQSRAPEDLPEDEVPALTLITKVGRSHRVA